MANAKKAASAAATDPIPIKLTKTGKPRKARRSPEQIVSDLQEQMELAKLRMESKNGDETAKAKLSLMRAERSPTNPVDQRRRALVRWTVRCLEGGDDPAAIVAEAIEDYRTPGYDGPGA